MRKTFTVKPKSRIVAADEDSFDRIDDDFDMSDSEDADGLMDAVDDVSDSVDDIKDAIDEVDEDSVDIALNNNIAGPYIAECDQCQGVFISAVLESDQQIDHVSGICPICGKESDQYLKWVIKDVEEREDEGV